MATRLGNAACQVINTFSLSNKQNSKSAKLGERIEKALL